MFPDDPIWKTIAENESFHPKNRFWSSACDSLPAAALLRAGRGSRDEDNRYVYLRFADPAFEAYCLEHWDLNGDGRISRYEAQRVWDMDCSSLGVKTLAGIEEFTALRKLDCSGNEIVALDVRKCIFMEQLNCSGNALISLDIKGLRFLNRLDCSNNDLTYINLATNAALENLWCGGNRFASLDISHCATDMIRVDTVPNESLSVLYKRAGQRILNLNVDGGTKVEDL